MVVLLFLFAATVRAFFALARSALINMRRPRLVELEQKGVTSARAIQQLTENSGRLLATAEVGALLGLVLAAGIATLGFVPPVLDWLNAVRPQILPPDALHPIAFLIVMLAAALFLFVFGRLVPEALALRYTEPMALALIRPMQVMSVLLAPFVRFAVVLSNLLSIPMGGQKREGATLVTEEEIKTLVDAGEEEGLIEEGEKEMIFSVLDFGDTVAREVMCRASRWWRWRSARRSTRRSMWSSRRATRASRSTAARLTRSSASSTPKTCWRPCATMPSRRSKRSFARSTSHRNRSASSSCCRSCSSGACTSPSWWTSTAARPAW
jgi:hypothetical protein